jgi:DnaJ-domain-containing protein 1
MRRTLREADRAAPPPRPRDRIEAVDVTEARAVLGLTDGDDWVAVRAAYRRLIGAAHPDRAGGTTRAAARLNEAYAVLSRARRAGLLIASAPGAPAPGAPTGASADPAPAPPSPPPVGVKLAAEDVLLLAAPPAEAFARLLDAAHHLGEVSYIDRSCAIFEVVVRVEGEACSLVLTVQPRGHGTEVLAWLESLEQPASHSPEHLLRQIASLVS